MNQIVIWVIFVLIFKAFAILILAPLPVFYSGKNPQMSSWEQFCKATCSTDPCMVVQWRQNLDALCPRVMVFFLLMVIGDASNWEIENLEIFKMEKFWNIVTFQQPYHLAEMMGLYISGYLEGKRSLEILPIYMHPSDLWKVTFSYVTWRCAYLKECIKNSLG